MNREIIVVKCVTCFIGRGNTGKIFFAGRDLGLSGFLSLYLKTIAEEVSHLLAFSIRLDFIKHSYHSFPFFLFAALKFILCIDNFKQFFFKVVA